MNRRAGSTESSAAKPRAVGGSFARLFSFLQISLWCKENRLWFLIHHFGQFLHRAVHHAACLTMLHTCRRHPFLRPLRTQVTKIRRKWNIVDGNFLKGFQNDFVYLDAPLSNRVVVLLFTGYLTGMAPRTVFVVDEQSVSRHISFLSFQAAEKRLSAAFR
jgi:hypothetical protein